MQYVQYQNVIVSPQTGWVQVHMLTVVTFGGIGKSIRANEHAIGRCVWQHTHGKYRSTCIGNTYHYCSHLSWSGYPGVHICPKILKTVYQRHSTCSKTVKMSETACQCLSCKGFLFTPGFIQRKTTFLVTQIFFSAFAWHNVGKRWNWSFE